MLSPVMSVKVLPDFVSMTSRVPLLGSSLGKSMKIFPGFVKLLRSRPSASDELEPAKRPMPGTGLSSTSLPTTNPSGPQMFMFAS